MERACIGSPITTRFSSIKHLGRFGDIGHTKPDFQVRFAAATCTGFQAYCSCGDVDFEVDCLVWDQPIDSIILIMSVKYERVAV
jgi:hypothetical protein